MQLFYSFCPSDIIMMTKIWFNIGSSNGLLPDSTKPLPQPTTYHQMCSVAFCTIHPRAISQVLMNLIHDVCSEIMLFDFQPQGQWVKFSDTMAEGNWLLQWGIYDIDGLMQHCSISSAFTQSCTKPLVCASSRQSPVEILSLSVIPIVTSILLFSRWSCS